MKVIEIFDAQYYRDGGSYAFMFESDDGEEYEFISNVVKMSDDRIMYKPPVIFWQDCNSGKVVKEFTWKEAKLFLEPLTYENEVFLRLKQLVNRYADNE